MISSLKAGIEMHGSIQSFYDSCFFLAPYRFLPPINIQLKSKNIRCLQTFDD